MVSNRRRWGPLRRIVDSKTYDDAVARSLKAWHGAVGDHNVSSLGFIAFQASFWHMADLPLASGGRRVGQISLDKVMIQTPFWKTI